MRIDREKLAVAMTRRDMNQKRLAELSGVIRVTITAFANGKSYAQATAEKLAAVLGPEILEKEARPCFPCKCGGERKIERAP